MRYKYRLYFLVEDDLVIATIEKKMLEEYGYKTIIANNGEAAIDIFRGNNSIDLIIMDIDLGYGIDGTEAAWLILKHSNVA